MTTKTARKTVAAHRAAEYAAHRARIELTDLAWRAARVRGLDHAMVRAVLDGTVTLDPRAVAREVEAYLGTLRLHEDCKANVRENGSAPYDYRGKYPRLAAHLCEGCAKPLSCSLPSGKHEYRELSGTEARAKGHYHGGRCYHVYECSGCGHVHAVDTSD